MTELTDNLKEKLSKVRLVAFDCDGTLWVGDHPLDGASSIIEQIRNYDINVAAITNNSTRNRKNLADKASKLGLNLASNNFYATNNLAADLAAERYPNGRVLVIGSNDLVKLIAEKGVEAVRPIHGFDDVRYVNWSEVKYDAVIIGLSVYVTYAELCQAVVAIQNGAEYIATNSDYTFPAAGGYLLPGNGSFVALIARVSGVDPIVLGKPEPFLVHAVMLDYGVIASEILIVGDRVDTDILCGINAGALTCQVMTGVAESDRQANYDSNVQADFVCKDLVELSLIFGEVFGGSS